MKNCRIPQLSQCLVKKKSVFWRPAIAIQHKTFSLETWRSSCPRSRRIYGCLRVWNRDQLSQFITNPGHHLTGYPAGVGATHLVMRVCVQRVTTVVDIRVSVWTRNWRVNHQNPRRLVTIRTRCYKNCCVTVVLLKRLLGDFSEDCRRNKGTSTIRTRKLVVLYECAIWNCELSVEAREKRLLLFLLKFAALRSCTESIKCRKRWSATKVWEEVLWVKWWKCCKETGFGVRRSSLWRKFLCSNDEDDYGARENSTRNPENCTLR